MDTKYRFRIDGPYTPETLPMQRLAEYASALATLLGEEANVHLAGVEQGSAVLVASVDASAQAKVQARVLRIRNGDAPADAQKAFQQLDDLLRADHATGSLVSDSDAVIVPFPGRERHEPPVFGPFKQDGTIDGQVIRVGGRHATIPIHLRDGAVIHSGLYANAEIARRIAQYYLGPTLRVHGTGTWYRMGGGCWELRSFKIADFQVLDDAPLDEVVQRLRRVQGSTWNEVPDPVRSLLEQRHGDGDAH